MAFLEQIFQHFSGHFQTWNHEHANDTAHRDSVEYIVTETFPAIRALTGYVKCLREPVATFLGYIDNMVESIPAPFLCAQETFGDDPRVRSFFVNPPHLHEVFSSSEEVRELFSSLPNVEECYALLCMHKDERAQFGMALKGDMVQKDVLQTAVNFSDHQVLAPGISEADARKGLKCCISGHLLRHIRDTAAHAKNTSQDMQNRLQVLRNHSNRTPNKIELDFQIKQLEQSLTEVTPHLMTLEEHLQFLTQVLNNPQTYLSANQTPIYLNRMGIKMETHPTSKDQILLSEIHIAGREPRIAALVRFPRQELLPQQSFVKRADFFLSIL